MVLVAFSLVLAVVPPGISAKGHFIVANSYSLTGSETFRRHNFHDVLLDWRGVQPSEQEPARR